MNDRRLAHFDGDLAGVADRAQLRTLAGRRYARAAQVLLDACHPKQRDFVADPARRIAVRCGGRAGKTTGGRARLVRRCLLTPRADCLFIATSRPQAEKLLWGPLKEINEKLSLEAHFQESALEMTFSNGSKITIGGADDKRAIERFRGIPRHEIGIDEAASFKAQLLEWLIKRVLDARLADYSGVMWMTGTPGHILRGEFYETTMDGSKISRPYEERDLEKWADWDGWSFHTWNMTHGAPHVPLIANAWKNALQIKAREGYSDDHSVWRREFLGLWAADDSADVFHVNPSINLWDPPRDNPLRIAELPKDRTDWEYVYGMDLGSSDPTAITVWAFSPTDPAKRLYQVWEHEQRGMYARSIASLLLGENLDTENPAGVIGHTGWPIGFVSDRDGSGDAILRELSTVYGIAIEPADKKNYHDSIELFNGDLIDGRILLLKDGKLVAQAQNQQWAIEEDTGRLKKHKGQRDDLTDSAIYARRKAHHMFSSTPTESPTDDPTQDWAPEARDAVQAADNPYADILDDGNYDFDDWE